MGCCFCCFRLDVLEKKVDLHSSLLERYVFTDKLKKLKSVRDSSKFQLLLLFFNSLLLLFYEITIPMTFNDVGVTETRYTDYRVATL